MSYPPNRNALGLSVNASEAAIDDHCGRNGHRGRRTSTVEAAVLTFAAVIAAIAARRFRSGGRPGRHRAAQPAAATPAILAAGRRLVQAYPKHTSHWR
jgi:hypothetical protein